MIYVMSDIHGNLRRFRSVMEQIDLKPEDTLYILGDVIDRHPHGIPILRKIMSMPNVKMLLGNHEYMMLRAMQMPYEPEDLLSGDALTGSVLHWYRNGGEVTHRHLKHIRRSIRAEIFQYLRALPLSLDITVKGKAYKLVHAAPPEFFHPPMEPYKSPAHYAVWKRYALESPLPGEYTMVFGHTPTRHFQPNCPMEVYFGEDRIGIDCGCGYPEDPDYEYRGYGRLACLRLDDGKVFYSRESCDS